MRCLVVAMTLVASTVLVHSQHWTPLARRGVIRTYRATGRAWRCWAFLSSVRPASVTKPPSPTKSLRSFEKRRLTNANDAFFGERDHWRDYGKPQRQTSLLVDPPNGRFLS